MSGHQHFVYHGLGETRKGSADFSVVDYFNTALTAAEQQRFQGPPLDARGVFDHHINAERMAATTHACP